MSETVLVPQALAFWFYRFWGKLIDIGVSVNFNLAHINIKADCLKKFLRMFESIRMQKLKTLLLSILGLMEIYGETRPGH